MRRTIVALVLLFSSLLFSQTPAITDPGADATRALVGHRVGYLEYRDYSVPATSTKRVQLPTWLDISANGPCLEEHFIYDDGPNKVVESKEQITLDAAHHSYKSVQEKREMTFRAEGFETLQSGLGTLTLFGIGTDNGKPADLRITLRIRRNLIEWTEESKTKGGSEAFAFRHMYRFTRAESSRPSAK